MTSGINFPDLWLCSSIILSAHYNATTFGIVCDICDSMSRGLCNVVDLIHCDGTIFSVKFTRPASNAIALKFWSTFKIASTCHMELPQMKKYTALQKPCQ